MASSAKLTLGYWKIRGLVSNIRYQLAYQGIADYEMVEYEQGDAPGYDVGCWVSKKFELGLPLPNLPYLIDPGTGVKISETQAIHRYLAEKYCPALSGVSPEENAEINQIFGVLSDLKSAVTTPCYAGGTKEKAAEISQNGIGKIAGYLGGKAFLVGANVKWVDFYFVEVLELMNFFTSDGIYEKYPALLDYKERIVALPNVGAQMEAERMRPFNNKCAGINNVIA